MISGLSQSVSASSSNVTDTHCYSSKPSGNEQTTNIFTSIQYEYEPPTANESYTRYKESDGDNCECPE
jgi:hypothetical protein